jgi:hypothetical protein
VCFQAAHTRGLARAAAAYASASSACPDADAEDEDVARKKSETPGSGAGRIGHRQGDPPTGAGAWKSVYWKIEGAAFTRRHCRGA